MQRTLFSWWLALVVLAWCAGLPAAAQERSGRVKGSAKDPIETAFELPQGTQLTSTQAKALNRMRHEYEPQIRDALEKMNSAPSEKTKRIDAKDVMRIRQSIRARIDDILNSTGSYEASGPAGPVTYESRYPTSAGTGEPPSNYYVPAYPTYGYPVYPGPYYPYYPRTYYYDPRYHTGNSTSASKPTSTTRSTTPQASTRPSTSIPGGSRYPNPNQVKH